jgi:hypothetical protein
MLAPDSLADARKLRSSGIAGLDESLNAESRRLCLGEPQVPDCCQPGNGDERSGSLRTRAADAGAGVEFAGYKTQPLDS